MIVQVTVDIDRMDLTNEAALAEALALLEEYQYAPDKGLGVTVTYDAQPHRCEASVILEGGLVRDVYGPDNEPIDNWVFDLDVEGMDSEELKELVERIADVPEGSKLREDLDSYEIGGWLDIETVDIEIGG